MKERIPRLSEKQIQQGIVGYLQAQNFLAFEFAKCGGHGALRGALPPGFPDILVIKNKHLCFLEVKVERGKISPLQEHIHAILADEGCYVYIVHSIEDVQEALMQEGFEIRGELV